MEHIPTTLPSFVISIDPRLTRCSPCQKTTHEMRRTIFLSLFLSLATSTIGLTLHNSILSLSALARREENNNLAPRSMNDGNDICIKRSPNGKTNGLSQAWLWGFADACKDAFYGTNADARKTDSGAWPQTFRYSSDNWAARFVYARPTWASSCSEIWLSCSDLVGKNADGHGDGNRLGRNIRNCYPKTDDHVYHGGEAIHWVKAQNYAYYLPCANLKIWRCWDGECGADFDDRSDPEKLPGDQVTTYNSEPVQDS